MKKIILNWMPPAIDNLPSPSMSVLKQHLVSEGYETDVIYWNLLLSKLQREFVWTDNLADKDMLSLHLLFNHLGITYNDDRVYKYIRANLKSIKPQYTSTSYDFFERHMEKFSGLFENTVDEYLSNINFDNVLFMGMSVNLYQWICSSIIAKKIKELNSNVPVVIGGIGTKESAMAYLDNFPQFDIALWGEGESSISELAKQLTENNYNFEKYNGIVYRKGNNILVSGNNQRKYVDLSADSVHPDFSDYFKFKELIHGKNIATNIPVEGGRGCHWNRCHFCYLNTGYRYRQKSIESIVKEVKSAIEKYNIFSFNFLDNDVIGRDKDRFFKLLSALKELKKEYPKFTILLAEVITNGINESMIKEMALAGFEYVQIGYESPSNELLKKIDKKNSFLSNLLFIKFADLYGIIVGGVNVIRGLLEETEDDVHESIDNLHSLRFFLKANRFYHTISHLGIFHSSRYFSDIQSEIPKWNNNNIKILLPKDYIKKENDNFQILEGFSYSYNSLWQTFEKIEKHYLQNNYSYQIISNQNTLYFKEYYNLRIINELEFEKNSKEWLVLESVNSEVKSFSIVLNELNEKSTPTTQEELLEIIDALEKEQLLFCSKDRQEMVSLINTNVII